MMNRFTILFAAPMIFAAPLSALATVTASTVFDTVDSAEIQQQLLSCTAGCVSRATLVVSGMLRGQATLTTMSFDFGNQPDLAAHCQRLAMVAMAKPGKYRFGIGADVNFGTSGACRLMLVTP